MDDAGDDDGGDRFPSPSPPPASSRPAATSNPFAVGATSHRVLTLALPAQQPLPGGAPTPSSASTSGREDCWSDGATSTLIDAWGERFLELSRGSLRQKQWQEVADAVSSRDGYTKSPKTDIQCKNRIDTLKRKYKNESCKVYGACAGAVSSSWPYFHRLDLLIGPTINPLPPTTTARHAAVPAPFFPELPPAPHFSPSYHPPPHHLSPSSDGQSDESSDGFPPETGNNGRNRQPVLSGMQELTQAVVRFGELYQRVEKSKMQYVVEMEEKRLAFTRELKEQRMRFFMKAQSELSQVKPRHRQHHNHQDGSSRKRKRASGGTSNNVNNNSYSSN